MDDELKSGFKSSSFTSGVAISLASMLVALSSDDWRVKIAVILGVTAIAVTYNLGRVRLRRDAWRVRATATTDDDSDDTDTVSRHSGPPVG